MGLFNFPQVDSNIAFALPDIADFHIHTSRFLKEYLFERGALVVMNYDGSALVFTGIQHPLDHITVGKMGIGHIECAAFYLGLCLSFNIYPLGKGKSLEVGLDEQNELTWNIHQ